MKAFQKKNFGPGRSFGAMLIARRKAFGVVRAEASSATGIAERYLRALEENDMHALPGMVYGKNFVRRYARYLQLSPAPLVRTFVEEYRGATLVSAARPAPVGRGPLLSPFRVRLGIGLMLSGIVVWYLGGEVRALVTPPQLAVTTPAFDIQTEARSIRVEGSTDVRARLMVNDQYVTNEDGLFVAEVPLQEGVNTITIRAETRHGRAQEVERKVIRTSVNVAQQQEREVRAGS